MKIKLPKQNYILLFLITVSLMSTNLYPESDLIVPKKIKKKVSLIISGKKRSYYVIPNNGSSSLIMVKGPGNLRILTRAEVNPVSNHGPDYSVFYKIDGGKEIKVRVENVQKSYNAKFSKNKKNILCISKSIRLDLGRGEHTIEIRTDYKKNLIVGRYLFKRIKPKKVDWIAINPVSAMEPVELITREDITLYYRFSSSHPLEIEIIGPTKLRIFTRFENSYKMKGRINYRLKATCNGKDLNTFLLSSVRSVVTVYSDNKNLLPGKVKEIFIDVPKGKHHYKIIPLDKDKGTILGRVLFPKKDTINKV